MDSSIRQLKVLVVDDIDSNQRVAALMLERLGCDVEATDNGESAVEMIADRIYDIVFMDCQMPTLNGYDATRMVRERESKGGHRTTIVAFTAQAMDGDREKCLAAGMDDYISKPVSLEDFATIVQQHLKKV